MGNIPFGKSPTMAEKVKSATARGYDTGKTSKGTSTAPKTKVTVKPTGGLKPSGVKIKVEKKTWGGKR